MKALSEQRRHESASEYDRRPQSSSCDPSGRVPGARTRDGSGDLAGSLAWLECYRRKVRCRKNNFGCLKSSPSYHRSTSRMARSCEIAAHAMDRATIYGSESGGRCARVRARWRRDNSHRRSRRAIATSLKNSNGPRALPRGSDAELDVSGGLSHDESIRPRHGCGRDPPRGIDRFRRSYTQSRRS